MSIADKLKTVAQKMEDVYRTGLFKYAPKLTASGETILLENSAPEPFVSMTVHGKSWQNGTPTPSTPIEIESAKEVKVYGKNLLDESTITSVNVSGGFCYHLDEPLFLKGGQTYTAKMYGCSEYPQSFQVYRQSMDTEENVFAYSFDSDTLTFALEEDTYCVLRAWWRDDNNIPSLDSVRTQLELGEYATNYEPYTEQTLTLPTLREGDIAMYKSGKKVQNSAFKNLSELYWKQNAMNNNGDGMTFYAEPSEFGTIAYLSEHFRIVYETPTGAWENLSVGECLTKDGYIIACTSHSSLEEFTSWLSSENVQALVKLAEPIETDLTDEEIYAFKRLRANSPNTTIVGQGQLDVTYIVDNRQ